MSLCLEGKSLSLKQDSLAHCRSANSPSLFPLYKTHTKKAQFWPLHEWPLSVKDNLPNMKS